MDLSKISHLEARQAIKEHFDSEECYGDEQQATATVREKINAARQMIREKQQELEREHVKPLEAELEALRAPFREKEQKRWEELEAKLKSLGVEFDDFQLHDDYCGVHRCEVSGLPLLDDDITGETPDGDPFLFDLVLQLEKAEA